jgi:hypothetical protein
LGAAALALFAVGLRPELSAARDQPGLRVCYGVVTLGRDNPDLRLMRVPNKTARLPFYRDRTERSPHCPAEMDRCRLRSFVVPGDLLLAGLDWDGFACAAYISPKVRPAKGLFWQTIGFVPIADLRRVTVGATAQAEWIGTWRRAAEAEIRIEPQGAAQLKIAGRATYGVHDRERVRRGFVNTGELYGVAGLPRQNMIALGEGFDGAQPIGIDRSACRARLRLFGPYLVVEDNGGCGGVNVSFTGVYVRPGRR